MVQHTKHYILMPELLGLIDLLLFLLNRNCRMMLDTQTYRRLMFSTLERLSNNIQANLDDANFPVTIWIDNYQVYQAHTAQPKTVDDVKDGSYGSHTFINIPKRRS